MPGPRDGCKRAGATSSAGGRPLTRRLRRAFPVARCELTGRGWEHSAEAWIRAIGEQGDLTRRLLLDPVMLREAGDVRSARVLDVGCGEGRFCRMLEERGARCIGLDPTKGLLRAAGEQGTAIVRGGGEQLPFEDAAFDLVVSYLTLVDIPDYRAAIGEMARVLTPGGRLLLANLGFTTAMDPWVRDDERRRLYRPMDRYFDERELHFAWSGISISNYHRPLGAYMDALLGEGLILERFLEPMPEDQSLREDPEVEDWFRIPEFLVMRWRKP
ncbi:MAG: class I SAM-dependent methyltransferase [Dehalococcoidia bacterium]|nr:class I SAM-dependent methyltransferase [Dehalococcoidia bacterium]